MISFGQEKKGVFMGLLNKFGKNKSDSVVDQTERTEGYVRDSEIVMKLIPEAENFEARMMIGRAVGLERLQDIVTRMENSNIAVPHIVLDVLGSLRVEEDKKAAEKFETATPEQARAMVEALGWERSLRIATLVKNSSKKHQIVDYATPLKYQESERFVGTIEQVAVKNYELAKSLVVCRKLDIFLQDIENAKTIRKSHRVEHIVYDVINPMVQNTTTTTASLK